MSNTVVRPVGYTGKVQQLEWAYGNGAQVTAYLWGGGGGGGGNDSRRGGYGSGGGYSSSTFTLNNGDVLKVAVGGQGFAGVSGRGSAGGGAAGPSWAPLEVFTTRTAVGSVPVIAYTNPAYCSFLNTYGVWVNPVSATYFDNTYTVNFPASGYYTIVGSCDNYGYVYIDGTQVLAMPDFHYTTQASVFVTAGNHTVRVYGVNTGGPGCVGVNISGGNCYSGARGGNAGGSGSSGGGGGGGGATVLLLNDVITTVAAGGGGGGGGGNSGAAAGQDAPGDRGQGSSSPGQNGQDKSGDGGGGGGGGGGALGGQGGAVPGGDQGGYAGVYGTNSGTSTSLPSGTSPGGTGSLYYSNGVATGGINTRPGTAGYAVFVFDIPGVFVHQGGSYTPVSKIWVKNNDIWRQTQSIWVKESGTWREVLGGMPPIFTAVSGNFGVNSREFG